MGTCCPSNGGIDSMCVHSREVNVLWDGAFLLDSQNCLSNK
jgi:hypothetical protein